MEWLAKGAGRLQECSSAMGFLPGTPNSQAHDFSMRARLPVQIGHTDKIGHLHRRRAAQSVDNAQWQYQFKPPALKSGRKNDQLLQMRYKWAFSLRKNNERSKIGQALI
ncbi:MAG: hypothetical protein RSF79_15575 [Janthinobacterium sp.]